MKTKGVFTKKQRRPQQNTPLPNRLQAQAFLLGGILLVALLAFELFNFDTTRFALRNLLGEVYFMRLHWATILAVAFCAIDFAGLARLFTPQPDQETAREVWFLMGAWLLGATMNAVMTWWAVSLTLLTHDFGNEVLTRAQLLRWVPFFIAALVWLTRILFIGALSMAGDYLFAPSVATDMRATTAAQPALPVRQPRRTPPATTRRPARGPSSNRRQPPQPVHPVRGNASPPIGMQAQKRR